MLIPRCASIAAPESSRTQSRSPIGTRGRSSRVPASAPSSPPAIRRAPPSGLSISPKLLEFIRLQTPAGQINIPHLAHIVVSTVLQTTEKKPICVLVPSTEHVVQFAAILSAIECLSAEAEELRRRFIEKLVPGMRVRILPEGYVFVVGQREHVHGMDGMFLRYTERDTMELNGRRLIPLDELFRYEPTTRQLPKSRRSIILSEPVLTSHRRTRRRPNTRQ